MYCIVGANPDFLGRAVARQQVLPRRVPLQRIRTSDGLFEVLNRFQQHLTPRFQLL